MPRFVSAVVLTILILATAVQAQDPPPPRDPAGKAALAKGETLTLSDDLVLLHERMIEVGTPKHAILNKYSFSAYIGVERLGKETIDKAFAMATTQKNDKAKKLVGATFSCYKVGTHFTHVIFHFEGTTVGGPLGEPAEFSAGIVQHYLLTVNDDAARRAPGTTIPGGTK